MSFPESFLRLLSEQMTEFCPDSQSMNQQMPMPRSMGSFSFPFPASFCQPSSVKSQSQPTKSNFEKCVADRAAYPKNVNPFISNGISCAIISVHKFGWNGYLKFPINHPDLKLSPEKFSIIYNVPNKTKVVKDNIVGFSTTGREYYCLLREMVIGKSEEALPYLSFDFVKKQVESLAKLCTLRLQLFVSMKQRQESQLRQAYEERANQSREQQQMRRAFEQRVKQSFEQQQMRQSREQQQMRQSCEQQMRQSREQQQMRQSRGQQMKQSREQQEMRQAFEQLGNQSCDTCFTQAMINSGLFSKHRHNGTPFNGMLSERSKPTNVNVPPHSLNPLRRPVDTKQNTDSMKDIAEINQYLSDMFASAGYPDVQVEFAGEHNTMDTKERTSNNNDFCKHHPKTPVPPPSSPSSSQPGRELTCQRTDRWIEDFANANPQVQPLLNPFSYLNVDDNDSDSNSDSSEEFEQYCTHSQSDAVNDTKPDDVFYFDSANGEVNQGLEKCEPANSNVLKPMTNAINDISREVKNILVEEGYITHRVFKIAESIIDKLHTLNDLSNDNFVDKVYDVATNVSLECLKSNISLTEIENINDILGAAFKKALDFYENNVTGGNKMPFTVEVGSDDDIYHN